ncbi:BAG family molecular chaperone regulator 8, chloroplastic-like [Chenopodium quinoa]|uniref:BAG domain-containing protein n=1 Tax=Chenopodium quinoa TaxID=63459 RepID=A0A803LSG9_CHEQI|nr:BAG family molecular chaperone regulator 8, chloroplastic-like [Chenopodium quinoa]
MAFHHHLHNLHTTTNSFCCCPPPAPPCHHPTPPCHHPPLLSPPTSDPFQVAAIVTQLLQTQTQTPLNYHLNSSRTHKNQKHPHHNNHENQDNSLLLSLLQRIDALESSLQKYSSSGFSLRDAAAKIIQAHFRAFLVHRSRTLRHLKDLASVKSALASFKSSLSRHAFVDFDSLSRNAMDLLHKLDSIQSGDKMIRDSKKTVTREIVEFLEIVDGVCVKRQQVLTRKMKSMRLVRNDSRATRDTKGFSGHNVSSKTRTVDNEEKKLMANLKERVEKIGRMTKALEEQEQEVYGDAENKGFKHVDDEDDDILDQIATKYRLNNEFNVKKNDQSSNAKKRVSFVEDGNLIRLNDTDGESRSSSRLVDVIEDSINGTHDEEEARSDGEGSSQSSEEMRKFRSDEVNEECDNQEEFTFSTTPEPATRANFSSRKPVVKISG